MNQYQRVGLYFLTTAPEGLNTAEKIVYHGCFDRTFELTLPCGALPRASIRAGRRAIEASFDDRAMTGVENAHTFGKGVQQDCPLTQKQSSPQVSGRNYLRIAVHAPPAGRC